MGGKASFLIMDTQTNKQKLNNNGQLIQVPHKDTIRLLEVYVKRSLSLNDGTPESKKAERKAKWVTLRTKHRRHSTNGEIGTFAGVEPQANLANLPETPTEEKEKSTKKSKKLKKSSLWKTFLGIFSRKKIDEKDEDQDSPAELPQTSTDDEAFEACPPPACPPQPQPVCQGESLQRNELRKSSVMSVEPTYSYYEKMSEELEKIVHEVKVNEEAKPQTDAEVIDRIIALTKEQGDAIDDKIKNNPTLSHFFQKMSYSSFQMLADAYLENEVAPVQNPPTVPPTAPELVKLAFTLDFTARIAGLSRQNIGHITGLGNRYLQDRFEYRQACTDHPWSDCDD
ncbi:hypothetical protein WMY93_012209 [Mugilogobius chulae]|uniref:Apoptosis facilitator Bcl-2-like protein 14 n=1 Tax=Mugilogobius chulae TaxID=88201 RepID=A0AAW0PGY3_9GOBI